MNVIPGLPAPADEGHRYVRCYCGRRSEVITRRDPSKDRYAVCSRTCFDRQVADGNTEPGTLASEILRG